MVSRNQFDTKTLISLSLSLIRKYNFEYHNRTEKRGGGVVIYIKETMKYSVMKDIHNLNRAFKHL